MIERIRHDIEGQVSMGNTFSMIQAQLGPSANGKIRLLPLENGDVFT